ncbi:hypothetical protein [Streptomyces sp. KHY 26]|uniref:hypothetical protein n=1 Tax=Streptomyces sp. KHY 26 TaxID=3097359 RepID=UPI00376EE482
MSPRVRIALNWGLPIALTAVALGWSVYAIGDLLSAQAPKWISYSAGALYDGVWLYALHQEREHRRQGSDGGKPHALGWVFLAVSVAVLFWHGMVGADLIAAVGGALIPALAKLTLVMAIDADNVRISDSTQRQLDRLRAGTRDKLAIGRASTWSKTTGQLADASLRTAEYKAAGDAHKALQKAQQKYRSVLEGHPVPDEETGTEGVPDSFGLITDDDIEAFLNGSTGPDVSAGGTPRGTGSARLPGTGDEKALALLAAEVYADIEAEGDEDPPSLREFRRRMRRQITERNWKARNELVDALYRHEKSLRTTADD